MFLNAHIAQKKLHGSSTSTAPILIAGPCSAESEEQVIETAKLLKPLGVSYFRAGIWKPRTRPGSFAGVGDKGLTWLNKVQQDLQMKVAIEVANARHVSLALTHKVDLLWIGARTSVNPFAVQEIADALKGVNIPVMVKNPINPDVALWIGAIERILGAGVSTVIACHRGFNVYGESRLRNAPLWEIPIELKRKLPEIPLVCDPSHISGKREWVEEIAQKAVELGYAGLMIESHIKPEEALSDAAQQLSPDALAKLLGKLRFRQSESADIGYQQQLRFLREEIDEVDLQLFSLIRERLEIARKIGTLKQENNVAFYQRNRWDEILKSCKAFAEEKDLDETFLQKIFSLLHLEAIHIQGE